MKIICCGDLHVSSTSPRYRTSSYYEQLLGKIKWIIDFANTNNIFTVLQPGDFFNSPDIAERVKVDIINTIGNTEVYVVFGQHDTKFRNYSDTALSVLIADETVELLGEEPVSYEEKKQVDIYGSSWGDDIPKIDNKNNYNILVLHRMIVKDKPLFPDQKDYVKSSDFADKCSNYNLIVSGDNHNSFSYIPKNKKLPTIVNCGSLMRMTTAQYTHKPCFYVVDTSTGKIEQHFIPILPVSEVFKPEAAESKEQNEKMEAFIKTLSTAKMDTQASFENNITTIKPKFEISVQRLADKFIAGYYA